MIKESYIIRRDLRDMDGTGQREQEEYERRRAAIRAQRRKRNRQEVIVKMVLGGVCFAILAVTGR